MRPTVQFTNAHSNPRSRLESSEQSAGFTLIELIIAMAILAIISAVAIPIYTSYSVSTYRAEAQADLLLCAQGIERFASENFTYVGGDDGSGGVNPQICRIGSTLRYTISAVTAVDSFTLTATPLAGSAVASDGFMSIDTTGQRLWDQDNSGTIDAGEDTWEEQ